MADKKQSDKTLKQPLIRYLSGLSFALAIAIIAGTDSYILFSLRTLTENNQKVTHTLETQNRLDHLLAHINELETGPRGYVTTGNERDLKPCFAATCPDGIRLHLRELNQQTTNDTVTKKEMELLGEIVGKKILLMEKVVNMKKLRGFAVARTMIAGDIDHNMMEDIRRRIITIIEREKEIFRQSSVEVSASLQHTIFSIVAGVTVSLSLLLLSLIAVNREASERRRSSEELGQLNRELDQRVEQRTIELQEELAKRTQEEVKVMHISRLYATLSQINEAIVRLNDRDELFKSVCHVAIEYGKFGLAWIGFLDHQTGLVTPAVFNDAGRYLPTLKPVNIKEIPFRNGIMGSAVESGTVAYSKNIQTDPAMRHWQELATAGGFYSAAAVPLLRNGVIIALLNLYATDVDFFTAGQCHLLEETGKDISFALDTIDLAEKHKLSVDALKKSEQLFREMFEKNSAIIIIFDPDTGSIIDANRSATEFYGWSTEKFRQMKLGEIDTLPAEELQVAMQQAVLREKKHFILRHRKSDGSIRDVEVYATRVDANGRCIMYSIIHDITERMRLEKANAFHLAMLDVVQQKTTEELLGVDH